MGWSPAVFRDTVNLFGLLALDFLGIQVHDEVLDVRERLFDEPFGDDPGDLAGETRGDSRSLQRKGCQCKLRSPVAIRLTRIAAICDGAKR